MAAEDRIGRQVGIERLLELIHEITTGHAPEQLATFGRESWVSRPSPAAALVEQIFTDGHEPILSPWAADRHDTLFSSSDRHAPTDLANLVFLRRWHHMRVHAGELFVEMVDGRPQFRNRDGVVLVEPRAGPAPPGDPPRAHAA